MNLQDSRILNNISNCNREIIKAVQLQYIIDFVDI